MKCTCGKSRTGFCDGSHSNPGESTGIWRTIGYNPCPGEIELEQIKQIHQLMTPVSVLEQTEFSKAWPILPERFPTFDELLEWRDEIKNLVILPVKSNEMRAYYNGLPKNELAKAVREKLGEQRFMFAENEFPYLVPEGTLQFIIWVNDPKETRDSLAEFILREINKRNFKIEDLILFERPLGITQKLVKGTFPLIRHVHLWTRK